LLQCADGGIAGACLDLRERARRHTAQLRVLGLREFRDEAHAAQHIGEVLSRIGYQRGEFAAQRVNLLARKLAADALHDVIPALRRPSTRRSISGWRIAMISSSTPQSRMSAGSCESCGNVRRTACSNQERGEASLASSNRMSRLAITFAQPPCPPGSSPSHRITRTMARASRNEGPKSNNGARAIVPSMSFSNAVLRP